MALNSRHAAEGREQKEEGESGQPKVRGILWTLLLALTCSSLLGWSSSAQTRATQSTLKTVKWGRLELKLPRQVAPGQAFTLHFSGRGAPLIRVRFPLEGFETLTSTLETAGSSKRSFVLGHVRLEDRRQIPLELISQYQILKLNIPLEVKKQDVQQLGFSEAEFLGINKNRGAEDFKLAQIYAVRSSRLWNKPFAAPARGRVTSPFGTPRQYTPGTPISYHTGMDYGSARGTPIYAVNDGEVAFVGKYLVRGNITVINHGLGVYTAYLHQSKVLVKVGQKVARGQQIGEVGTTGLSTAPHLHLEFRLRGVAVSPLEWIGEQMP